MPASRVRAYVEGALRKLGAHFQSGNAANAKASGVAPTGPKLFDGLLSLFRSSHSPDRSGTDEQLRLLEEGIKRKARRTDALTQTPDWDLVDPNCRAFHLQHNNMGESVEPRSTSDSGTQGDLQPSDLPGELRDSEAAQVTEDDETTQTMLYPNRDRIVVVNDRIAFLLTKETTDRLRHIFVATRSIKECQRKFKAAEREASIGQSFIDNSESEMNEPTIPEHIRMEVKQDLEQQMPRILADIQRKQELERELEIQTVDLEYFREQSDEIFEQIMTDAGIIEDPEETINDQDSHSGNSSLQTDNEEAEMIEEAGNEVEEHEEQMTHRDSDADKAMHMALEEPCVTQHDINQEESEIDIAQREHHQALHHLRSAKQAFNLRDEAYYRDLERYGDGTEHSREDIDLFHLRIGMEFTRNLLEAEQEFERSRVRAQAFGILTWSTTSSDAQPIYDDDDDGYLDSEDPANNADMTDSDLKVINTWVAEVDVSEESVTSEMPAMEWEAQSVNMSDSVSVCDENPRQRRRIDQWRKQQESLREMDFGF